MRCPTGNDCRRESCGLSAAGAFLGVAAGGFAVSALTQLGLWRGWPLPGYELVAALSAAVGVWLFSSGRSAARGLAGMVAALSAILLGELFRTAAFLHPADWPEVPKRMLEDFPIRDWRKLLRCLYGVYIGWHLGYCGRAARPEGRSEEATRG